MKTNELQAQTNQKQTGLIHIYHGDGKGKTTAAVGLSVRVAGGKGKVLFYQFLKDGKSNEIKALKKFSHITVPEGYDEIKFSFQMTEEEKRKTKEYYTKEFDKIINLCQDSYQLLVLDEILHAINLGYLELGKVVDFLKHKPSTLEVVMTGRNPSKELIELADYITEMKKEKHPFDQGVSARKLIEY